MIKSWWAEKSTSEKQIVAALAVLLSTTDEK
ncbi:general secretion pathway protein M [Escherichia coli]|nr:general secretion pathway protein M [Escherichia coli]